MEVASVIRCKFQVKSMQDKCYSAKCFQAKIKIQIWIGRILERTYLQQVTWNISTLKTVRNYLNIFMQKKVWEKSNWRVWDRGGLVGGMAKGVGYSAEIQEAKFP